MNQVIELGEKTEKQGLEKIEVITNLELDTTRKGIRFVTRSAMKTADGIVYGDGHQGMSQITIENIPVDDKVIKPLLDLAKKAFAATKDQEPNNKNIDFKNI